MYKLRVMPNRSDVTQHHGGSPETEKAVQAALKWLADNQAADGRWKAGDHGAGRDENVHGHDRQNAGSQADYRRDRPGPARFSRRAAIRTKQGRV